MIVRSDMQSETGALGILLLSISDFYQDHSYRRSGRVDIQIQNQMKFITDTVDLHNESDPQLEKEQRVDTK